jgi:hypothetical protein
VETSLTNTLRTPPEQLSGDALSVTPSTPIIGAEITGIDLRAPVPPHRAAEIRRLLAHHKVIFFRDQSITAEQQLAFGRSLGSILRFPGVNAEHPQHPGVQIVGSWRPPARRPDGSRYTGGWHIDASGLIVAPFASIRFAQRGCKAPVCRSGGWHLVPGSWQIRLGRVAHRSRAARWAAFARQFGKGRPEWRRSPCDR